MEPSALPAAGISDDASGSVADGGGPAPGSVADGGGPAPGSVATDGGPTHVRRGKGVISSQFAAVSSVVTTAYNTVQAWTGYQDIRVEEYAALKRKHAGAVARVTAAETTKKQTEKANAKYMQ